ncbi:MAG TPA: phosphatase PAP2 family protein, partial [Actinomycetota bacterium]|nr:phosphatase PAP2 family protein [Actinomycetota bacterium]
AAWFVPVIAVVAIIFALRRDITTALYLLITSLIGNWLNQFAKAIVDRDRPDLPHPVAHASGQAFPSGHAMAATVCFGALLVAFWPYLTPRQRAPAVATYVIVVLLVATSRVVLGVHYPTDVVAGIVLGALWLTVMTLLFGKRPRPAPAASGEERT